VEQREEYLRDREKQVKKVNDLMEGVHAVAVQLVGEAKVQSEKLDVVDNEMQGAE
jgi:hypothetical protein